MRLPFSLWEKVAGEARRMRGPRPKQGAARSPSSSTLLPEGEGRFTPRAPPHCAQPIGALRQTGRSSLRHSGLAQAFEDGLELGQIRRVIAHRRPGGSAAGDGVGRVERETGPGRGARLIESPKLREAAAK